MKQVTVSIPATSANLGPGFDSLGIALGLRNTIRLSEADSGLSIELSGEGADTLPTNKNNVVVKAAFTLFDKVGFTPSGLRFEMENRIPSSSGLGSSAAARVGGLVAANALLDKPLSEDEILKLAVELEGHADNASPALLGGLTISSYADKTLVVRRISLPPMKVIVVMTDIRLSTESQRAALPAHIPMANAAANIGRAALVVEAIRSADYDLLSQVMVDRLHIPYRKGNIPGYDAAVEAGLKAGAAAVTLSGAGPSLIAFSADHHEQIGAAMATELEAATGKSARVWVLLVERKGVIVTL